MNKMKSAIFKTLFLSLCIVANTTFLYAQTASILPPGYTQYLDNNGKPLTSGKVYNYIPSTTTLKTTWQDSGEAVANTNPVILDAGGRAKILGNGAYRQIVKDRSNNTIWDAVTSSTGSGSSSTTSTGDGDLVGTIKPWAGMTAPNQYAFTYGQEVSRTTYVTLFTAITSSQATFCNSGSPTINGLGDTTNFWVGMSLEISCVAAGFTTVVSKTSTTVVMAANANVTANTTAIFFPWGRGNGTTTFNLPDFRGLIPVGNNIMGGVASSNLTATYFGATDPNSSGALGGSQSTTLITGNLPAYTPAGTNAGTAVSSVFQNITAPGVGATHMVIGSASGDGATGAGNTVTQPTFTGTAQGGTSTPFSRVQPSRSTNYIIKITPDTNSATASGVTSLGGMVGDIACGAGLLCTGNNISVTTVNITAANVSFTQNGTGATATTLDALLRTIVVTPEMFGAVCSSSFNSGPAIQRAINYLASITAGTVQFSNCLYSVNTPITISTKGISLVGMGSATGNGTEIYYTPSTIAECAITLSAGAGILSDTQIRNMSIRSPDTTTYKTAICASDSSQVIIRDVFIYGFTGGTATAITGAASSGAANEIRLTVASASINYNTGWSVAVSGVGGTVEANFGWPITVVDATHIDLKGSTFTNAYTAGGTITAASSGLQTKGREFINLENVSIAADVALRISVNPNYATNTLDQSNFNNLTLISTSTSCNVMVDDGGVLSSIKFTGNQSWGGGKSAFCWRDKSGPAINEQISFDNVRSEQKSVAGGWYFDIQPNNLIYSLRINNLLAADRDGIRARNVANLQIDNPHFIDATKTCLDVTSTVQNTQINNGYFIAGSTATLTGQTLITASGKNPSTGCLPPFAVYTNTSVGANIPIVNTSMTFSPTTGGVVGTTTNNSATAGIVGEYIESVIASGSAVSLSTGGAKDITTISLTVGDWDVDAISYFTTDASTNYTRVLGYVSDSGTNTLDLTAGRFNTNVTPANVPGAGIPIGVSVPPYRFSLASTTTIRLGGFAIFSAGTFVAWGKLSARRVR